jgi:hypothetical protein
MTNIRDTLDITDKAIEKALTTPDPSDEKKLKETEDPKSNGPPRAPNRKPPLAPPPPS